MVKKSTACMFRLSRFGLWLKKNEAGKARVLLDDLKQSFADASAETTGEPQVSDNESETEEEPLANRPSGKLKFFIIGLMIGIILAGSYAAYYIREMNHYSGIRIYDDNKDGKPDKWVTYANRKVSHGEFDRNFDGKIDYWYTYDDQGIVIRSQEDNDFNGIPDITHYYVDGILDSAEFHPNGSAIIIKKQSYESGVLKEEWVDTNRDGKFDEKNTYDFTGDKINSSPL